MIDHAKLNLIFALISGWFLILVCAMAGCLAMYITTIKHRFEMSWVDVLSDRTRPGIRLARPMITIKIGAASLLAVAWVWKMSGDGGLTAWQFNVFLVSSLILTAGGVWLVRVLTFDRFGEKAWMSTVAVMLFYLLVSLVFHYGKGFP